MYIQIVNLRVKPGRVDDFLDAFRKNREGTRKEPGSIQFDLLRSRNDQHRFVVYEVFESEDALAAHRQTEHYKECNRRFSDILEGDRSIDVLRPVMMDRVGT
jgi:(4S)-4-hydroxy-5-phosphonooxypentane-2,3-dione isomerase